MIHLPPSTASGRMRRKTLIKMRWLAIIGQLAALLAAKFVFELALDITAPLLIIGASVIFNIVATIRGKDKPYLHNLGATFALGFDSLQLALLLFVTGGFTNPFVFLMLAPVTVGATVLSGRSIILLTAINLLGFALFFFSSPLKGTETGIFFYGIAAALLVTEAFLVLYVRRVAREARRLAEALHASRMALEYEQKISAFGALAAAVAHELGSPLSTIAVVAKELARDLGKGKHSEDMDLLQSEVTRCREILSDFSRHNTLTDAPHEQAALQDLIEDVIARYPHDNKNLEIRVVQAEGEEPLWPMQAGLMHGIGNIIQNALHFAKTSVRIEISWQDTRVALRVRDDGPGFPPDLVSKLGVAYVSGRDKTDAQNHMGLGLFIAKTLLERSGANVVFTNTVEENGTVKGAEVLMEWHFTPT